MLHAPGASRELGLPCPFMNHTIWMGRERRLLTGRLVPAGEYRFGSPFETLQFVVRMDFDI